MVGSAMSSGELAAMRLEGALVNATLDSSKLGLQTLSSFGLQSGEGVLWTVKLRGETEERQ